MASQQGVSTGLGAALDLQEYRPDRFRCVWIRPKYCTTIAFS